MLLKLKYKRTSAHQSPVFLLHLPSNGVRHVEIPIGETRIFEVLPSDLKHIEDTISAYPDELIDIYYYLDDAMSEGTGGDWTKVDSDLVYAFTPGVGEYVLDTSKEPDSQDTPYNTIVCEYVNSDGSITMSGGDDDYNNLIVPYPIWTAGSKFYCGSGDAWMYTKAGNWVPAGEGGGATVEFQYTHLPEAYKLPAKTIQYIGTSGEDPLCPEAFRGDWLYSTKNSEGEYEWILLMHNGQIIEVQNMNESNWKCVQEFEGYRVYLIADYQEEIKKPDGTSYNPKRYKTWVKGWYQVTEQLKPDGSHYNPRSYYWKAIRMILIPTVGQYWSGLVDVKTEERECHVVANIDFDVTQSG